MQNFTAFQVKLCRRTSYIKISINMSNKVRSYQLNAAPTVEASERGFLEGVVFYATTLFIILFFPWTIWHCIKVVKEYEKGILFRMGYTQGGAKGPGVVLLNPITDRFRKVDLRTVSFNVPPQEILTRDSVTVQVDAVVYYHIFNAVLSVVKVEDVDTATRLLAQTTLRTILGHNSLTEILGDRTRIMATMQITLDSATDAWGIKVERVEIKDVRLPVSLQRSMAAEAEATREARAKVISADGEMNASRKLREAGEIMTEAPQAMQLRYLQTLMAVSAEKNSTIVFPLPVDMMTS